MTKEEYDIAIKEIEHRVEDSKKKLAINYATSNNPYKVGDVITDHFHTIRIERWKTVLGGFSYPSLVYYGTVLNKDGKDAKNQKDNYMYQENIIK